MDLIAPTSAEHFDPLVDLFARTFSPYWTQVGYAREGYIGHSPYDWEASRIGVVDGEIATHFGVWDYRMRIGGSLVRLAAIGAVATHEPHRKKGLMDRTARDCVDAMSEAGYDMSLLFGIPGFYQRFGYVCAFSQIRTTLKTKEVKALDRAVPYEAVEGPAGDLVSGELAKLSNRDNEGVTGTFLRPTYRTNRMPEKFTVYRFAGGYVVGGADGSTWQVADCAGDPETVVEVARLRATAEVCPEIDFVFLPPRSRLGEHLQTLTHRRIANRHAEGGPMMKIVNLRRAFEKIAPELGRRLGASPLRSYRGRLAVEGDAQRIVLGIDDGRVEVAADAGDGARMRPDGTVAAGAGLARLVIGDGDPMRVCRQSGIGLSGDARDLLPVLFPDQEPSTILWDRF